MNIKLFRFPIKIATLIVTLFLFSSCGDEIKITTNSFADSKIIPHGFLKRNSFFIEPINIENQLLSKEICRKIELYLELNGYSIQNEDKADFYVSLNFDIKKETKTIYVEKILG